MCVYELGILGSLSETERSNLSFTLEEMVSDFDLAVGKDILIHDANSIGNRNKRAAIAVAYFGNRNHADATEAQVIASEGAPIIPVIPFNGDIATDIPNCLQSINALQKRSDDPEMIEVATAMLECIGLLRSQRRVFVSYRRIESRAAALQLHDLLSGRGFDVFLDTHDIRPGEPFQEILWQRLCDSDVLLMLDTPGYFESKWTRHEIGRARAKEIHVLRVTWPGHEPNKMTDLAETIFLDGFDLEDKEGPLVERIAERIILKVEQLRSRSIAARHMTISGKLRAEAEKIGATVVGIGAHRSVSLRLVDDSQISAYPVVGVPTAQLLNDVYNKARDSGQDLTPILVYDHVGLGGEWRDHLDWLDQNIKVVRAIKVSDAGWELAGWGS